MFENYRWDHTNLAWYDWLVITLFCWLPPFVFGWGLTAGLEYYDRDIESWRTVKGRIIAW